MFHACDAARCLLVFRCTPHPGIMTMQSGSSSLQLHVGAKRGATVVLAWDDPDKVRIRPRGWGDLMEVDLLKSARAPAKS